MEKLIAVAHAALAIGVSLMAGVIGSLFTAPNIGTWYATLQKPAFTPPGWLFGPVWTALYVMMGIALFIVWRRGPDVPGFRLAIAAFALQLVLNALWSPLFFGMQSPMAGMAVIVPLWLAIVWTIVAFWRISPAAGGLLLPYLAWVSFATVLNWSIWMLNR